MTFRIRSGEKYVNLVDLVKSFPTNIYLQNLASIQKRTSPIKFAHLAEKSEKGSIPNLSTKVDTGRNELDSELRNLRSKLGIGENDYNQAQRERSAKIKLKIKKTCFEN